MTIAQVERLLEMGVKVQSAAQEKHGAPSNLIMLMSGHARVIFHLVLAHGAEP